jgi:hypothetical protein
MVLDVERLNIRHGEYPGCRKRRNCCCLASLKPLEAWAGRPIFILPSRIGLPQSTSTQGGATGCLWLHQCPTTTHMVLIRANTKSWLARAT